MDPTFKAARAAHTAASATYDADLEADAAAVVADYDIRQTSTSTQEQANELFEAFEAGVAWAESLKIGDVFRGSHGEASHRGLEGTKRSFFGNGALDVLHSYRIFTNNDGIITAL